MVCVIMLRLMKKGRFFVNFFVFVIMLRLMRFVEAKRPISQHRPFGRDETRNLQAQKHGFGRPHGGGVAYIHIYD